MFEIVVYYYCFFSHIIPVHLYRNNFLNTGTIRTGDRNYRNDRR